MLSCFNRVVFILDVLELFLEFAVPELISGFVPELFQGFYLAD